MRTTDAVRRRARVTALSFLALAAPGLGLALLTAWVVSRGVPICWPRAFCGRACVLILTSGLLCWVLPGIAAAAGGWQWVRTVRGLTVLLQKGRPAGRRVGATAPPPRPGDTFAVVDDDAPWALTHGFLRPRVAVSSALVARLSPEELAAVLAHEEHHRRCREPLRLVLARVARAVLWFQPAAGRLLEAYTAAAELAADAYALERAGRRALAQALWKLHGAGRPVAAVPFAPAPTLLRRRVEQIDRYPEPTPDPWPRRTDVLATAAAAAVVAGWSLLCLRV